MLRCGHGWDLSGGISVGFWYVSGTKEEDTGKSGQRRIKGAFAVASLKTVAKGTIVKVVWTLIVSAYEVNISLVTTLAASAFTTLDALVVNNALKKKSRALSGARMTF